MPCSAWIVAWRLGNPELALSPRAFRLENSWNDGASILPVAQIFLAKMQSEPSLFKANSPHECKQGKDHDRQRVPFFDDQARADQAMMNNELVVLFR
jgi:hypothetical protein